MTDSLTQALTDLWRTLAEFVARSRLVRELGGRPAGHPQRGRPVPWDRLVAESGLERAPFTPDRG